LIIRNAQIHNRSSFRPGALSLERLPLPIELIHFFSAAEAYTADFHTNTGARIPAPALGNL
jgi:hypothetical protein